MIVVLTACFPQDSLSRAPRTLVRFLRVRRHPSPELCLLCGGACRLHRGHHCRRHAGRDRANTTVFMLAISRASEISMGIVCAGIVLAGTDLGRAQRRLAASFAALAAEIASRLTGTLARAGPELLDTESQRRELVRRVIALEPVVDQAIGESSELRYHSPILHAAIDGLFAALGGWWRVAAHLRRLPDEAARVGAETVLRTFPPELQSVLAAGAPTRWMAAPMELRCLSEEAMRTLLTLPADTPSLRLLADQTAKLLAGILRAIDGIALLLDVRGRALPGHGS
jgi:hypothetical protein